MALSRQGLIAQHIICAAAFAFVAGMAAPVLAQQPPAQPSGLQLFGSRDFEMDWRMQQGNRMVRLRYSAELKRLRIEALDGSGQAMLKDLAGGGVTILVDEGRKGVFAAPGQPMPRGFGSPTGEIRSILGEQCQDFDLEGARLCLSRDGIPIGVTQRGEVIVAERLVRQAQNPALFLPPKDAKPQPIPGRAGTGPLPF